MLSFIRYSFLLGSPVISFIYLQYLGLVPFREYTNLSGSNLFPNIFKYQALKIIFSNMFNSSFLLFFLVASSTLAAPVPTQENALQTLEKRKCINLSPKAGKNYGSRCIELSGSERGNIYDLRAGASPNPVGRMRLKLHSRELGGLDGVDVE